MNQIKILMVDDHPMILEGYQNTLKTTKKDNQTLHIDIATNADEAIGLMNKSIGTKTPYDVLFLDIKIPPSKKHNIESGTDIAIYARDKMPKAKVIILTMFNESYRIQNIINSINPEGFLVKSDMTASELSSAFQVALQNPPFYSGTIIKSLNDAKALDLDIDDKDRKILHYLGQGIKTKHLVNHISLSLSMIEKRKHKLKMILDVENGLDDDLILAAKQRGLL